MSIMDLKKGESATILEINQPSKIKMRLNEFGLIKGAKITLKWIGPFKSTLIIKILDYHLALRKSIASKIIVGKL